LTAVKLILSAAVTANVSWTDSGDSSALDTEENIEKRPINRSVKILRFSFIDSLGYTICRILYQKR